MRDAADPTRLGLAERLRERGLRVTLQRMTILTALTAAKGHPTAEELCAAARQIDDTVSIATVYRTLSALEQTGLIHRLVVADEAARFEMVPRIRHDHLVDIDTGEILEIRSDELTALRARIAAEMGYEIVEEQMIWRGRRRSAT